jgi:pimeloyl-ACP methyl ester carboxylesterase
MATPSLLLVHGSWHGPWCWDRLLPELAALGISAQTVALPSCDEDQSRWGGLAADAAAVVAAAAALAGPVAVLGHSYGGVVVSAALMPANVQRLIFLGAFMPDDGRSLASYLPPGPLPPFVRVEGAVSLAVAEAVPAHLYNTSTPEDAAAATARLVAQDAAVIVTPVGTASWHRLPSDYIRLTQDRTIPPPLQAAFAAQADRSHDLDSDHSPFICRPGPLAALTARILATPI